MCKAPLTNKWIIDSFTNAAAPRTQGGMNKKPKMQFRLRPPRDPLVVTRGRGAASAASGASVPPASERAARPPAAGKANPPLPDPGKARVPAPCPSSLTTPLRSPRLPPGLKKSLGNMPNCGFSTHLQNKINQHV